ncbi:hypothetical protein [Thalassobacillus sp. CUG 92003]|uniref:hypothetical protein n=1 Tax=Thalassobacillus sp. CUG 92003 TaxID=2736641 RepID=UPI0015E63701|nr:hypothetical protein [Thalassobacillus sp. CUG 92003]
MNTNEHERQSEAREQYKTESYAEDEDMDVLNLPPRSEVHTGKKTAMNVGAGVPLVRLLVIFIVLATIAVLAYMYWGELFNDNEQTALLNAIPNTTGTSLCKL